MLSDTGDERNKGFCVHCGGPYETDDHVPPKLWLDDPLPENLAMSPACKNCNKACAEAEAYLACLLECVIAGSNEPTELKRSKVAELLASNFKLKAMMNSASKTIEGRKTWSVDEKLVRKAVLKLVRTHAAYEAGEPRLDEPYSIRWKPLLELSEQQLDEFEKPECSGVWPEVGSRAMSRIVISDSKTFNGWIEVQPGNYRFMALYDGLLRIRMVLREYLACEVEWD